MTCLSLFPSRAAVLSAFVLAASLTAAAHAAPINVVNGSFEQSTGNGQVNYNTTVTGWSGTGYNFLYTSGTADTTGAYGSAGTVKLYGPGNGNNNGLTASSPDGGNFIAMDGAYEVGAISQTLTGLTPGAATTVSFYFAGAQQANFTGATTEQFEVSLGSQNLYTPILNDANHGFTGWQQENLTFTPTSTTEVLSFLAIGTPGGEPPFSLLDGVSVSDTTPSPVPEPASLTLLMTGAAGIGSIVRRRFRK